MKGAPRTPWLFFFALYAFLSPFSLSAESSESPKSTSPPSSVPSNQKKSLAKSTPTPTADEISVLHFGLVGSAMDASNEIKEYLRKAIGKDITFEIFSDVTSLAKAFKDKRIDFSYTGPVSYVKAKEVAKIEPLAAVRRGGSILYQSVVVVDGAARFRQPSDFRSKRIGFVKPPSLSGFWMPRFELAKRKIVEGGKLGYVQILFSNHEEVAQAIESGKIDAGGMSKSVYRWLVQKKRISPSKVAVYLESVPFPEYAVCSRSDLPASLKIAVRRSFLTMREPDILKKLRIEGFGPASDKDFEGARIALLSADQSKER